MEEGWGQGTGHFQDTKKFKSEARSTKSETNSNDQNKNDQNKKTITNVSGFFLF